MAELAAAFGSSHSPALNSPAEDFAGHARRDEQYPHHLDLEGNRVSYQELVRLAPASMREQISEKSIADRVAACERHLDRMARSIADARLDALVVVGDDQREQYFEDNTPAFLVYCGASIINSVLELPGAPEYWRRARSLYHEPDAPREYPVARDLALHLVDALMDEFDLSYADRLAKPRGEGHAFGFVHRRLMKSQPVPVVPLVVNTYYPPNQPRPRRCFRLGSAIRRAVEHFRGNERIGIIASGGLSHFTLDEALDRLVLEACRSGDEETLAQIAPARLNSGNSEIRNWIVMAGAAAGLRPQWQEYVPLYRTPAGTGCGMAFAAWSR